MTKAAVHPSDLTARMARFMAELAPSVTRGQPATTRECAIKYLRDMAVELLSDLANSKTFCDQLDTRTTELQSRLPNHSWAVARKCLNIFLRDATFNFHLRAEYGLDEIEPFLEVPLDSRVVDRLRDACPSLEKWDAIKRTTKRVSDTYQQAAATIADRRDIPRVYLDLWYYPSAD